MSAEKFLANKVCLVTGGAQGVGWALAQRMLKAGARVYVCDVSQENLENAQKSLVGSPQAECLTLTRCDVSNGSEVARWVDGIYAGEGRIDVLVNNAAFVRWNDFLDMSVEDELRIMRVGYDGMVHCCHAVIPKMLAGEGGHVVNIGSSAGKLFVGSSSAAYAAAKAGIDGYTQTLQTEFRGKPLHFTLVRPGVIAGTDFFRKHVPSNRIPRLGDLVPSLTPDDVVNAIVKAISRKKRIVDIPGFLPFMYLLFELIPDWFRWLCTGFGAGTRDYAALGESSDKT
jgi:NAD(P)-dependent dehydrogenase (short-subunit alcohol dehydrogenase family)